MKELRAKIVLTETKVVYTTDASREEKTASFTKRKKSPKKRESNNTQHKEKNIPMKVKQF